MYLVYGTSQWLTQWVRRPLVAYCLAPAVAALAIGYAYFAITSLGAGYILIVLSIVVTFIASRLMMQPWMDSRTNLGYWITQSGFLLLAILLPACTFLLTLVFYPGMSSSLRKELLVESSKWMPGSAQLTKQPWTMPPARDEENPVAMSKDWNALIASRYERMESSLRSRPGPIAEESYHHVGFVLKELALNSDRISAGNQKETIKLQFKREMRIACDFAIRLRMSSKLMSQEIADLVERALFNEIKKPDRREALGDVLFDEIVKTLGDRKARGTARRRALVVSWLSDEPSNRLGSILIPEVPAPSLLSSALVQDRRRGILVESLVVLMNQTTPSEARKSFDEFASKWNPGSVRVSIESRPMWSEISAPGQLWNREWEVEAEQFAKEHKSNE